MRRYKFRTIIKDLQTSTTMRWPSLSYGVLPVIVIIFVVIACLIGYGFAMANVEDARSRSVDRRLREYAVHVDTAFDSYAHVLWGSTGRLQSGGVDEATWQTYMDAYDLPKNFNGMEAIGVSFGDSPSNNVITYVLPKTETTIRLIGSNMGEESALRVVMDQAARTGDMIITEPFQNLLTTESDNKPTGNRFLMYAPFYDVSMPRSTQEERMAALRGFTVALFRGDAFFKQIEQSLDLTNAHLRVYAGGRNQANELYRSGAFPNNTDLRIGTQEIDKFGKEFTLEHRFDSATILPWTLTHFPQFLLYGGLILGLLFAAAAGYLLRTRYNRMTIEKERDVKFAQDELLSLASHQLRTPATGVKQYLGMVLQGFAGDLNDKQRTYLERAYASNNRQLGVINDILHLAKLETGRIVLSERKFDIAKMVRDVVDEQREAADKGDIKVHLTAPPQGMIIGDSHMLRMVIENLVSNAIKYTSEGGIVTIRLSKRGAKWVLMVKDTGVGIAKSDFSKLFKQFSRISNPRSEFVTGTGVGLYLSYHLTVLHGGSISVSSTKGKGSTFTVRLPRKL